MENFSQVNPISLFFAAIFSSNILLAGFLGMCSFIAVSKDYKSSSGLGIAVLFVLLITDVLNWLVLHYLLIPYGLEYLSKIVFILVIAATVQVLEMLIDRLSPELYMSLGIFLPLITVNCAIFGGAQFLAARNYTLVQTVTFSLGAGIGWWLAIVALAAIREKTDKVPTVPEGLKGTGLVFITIGLMAMAFVGFGAMLKVQ